MFVLIPGRELSGEELLEIIDGYAQLGLTLDANGLSWCNCMHDDGIGEMYLDENTYFGLDSYRFWPARRMTDDELLQIQAEWLHGEEQSGEQSLTNEQAAREQPHKLLAMERGYEEFGNASQWSLFNDNLRHRG